VKARFKGKVRLQDLNPPQTYTIVGEGEGGIAGFAKGNAAVTLTDIIEGTNLSYRARRKLAAKLHSWVKGSWPERQRKLPTSSSPIARRRLRRNRDDRA
jgi:carbon monoxide dehydrogenase subunit G